MTKRVFTEDSDGRKSTIDKIALRQAYQAKYGHYQDHTDDIGKTSLIVEYLQSGVEPVFQYNEPFHQFPHKVSDS